MVGRKVATASAEPVQGAGPVVIATTSSIFFRLLSSAGYRGSHDIAIASDPTVWSFVYPDLTGDCAVVRLYRQAVVLPPPFLLKVEGCGVMWPCAGG